MQTKQVSSRHYCNSIFILFLVLSLTSCSIGQSEPDKPGFIKRPLQSESSANFQPLKLNTLAVLGFLPTSGGPSVEQLEGFSQQLAQQIDSNSEIMLIRPSESKRAASAKEEISRLAAPAMTKAKVFGERVEAQGVLYGAITRFNESTGSKFGANQPAAVGFSVWIVSVKTSEVLWKATYEIREQPLTENLFRLREKLKDGIGYKTSSELLRDGFRAVAKKLESMRAEARLRAAQKR